MSLIESLYKEVEKSTTCLDVSSGQNLIHATALLYSDFFFLSTGNNVYFKLENEQRKNYFKMRGTANKILSSNPLQQELRFEIFFSRKHGRSFLEYFKLVKTNDVAKKRSIIVLSNAVSIGKKKKSRSAVKGS